MRKESPPRDPQSVPPIGVAPEGRDLLHPWIISGIISLICFGIGFGLLRATGWWSPMRQWADAPFRIYLAVLLPVLLGFAGYAGYLIVEKVLAKRGKNNPPPSS